MSREYTVSVDASSATWTTSGFRARNGEKVIIKAQGTYTIPGGNQVTPDGTGTNPTQDGFIASTLSQYALICRIGEQEPFVVGGETEYTAPQHGELLFIINANKDSFGKNSGSLQVTVEPWYEDDDFTLIEGISSSQARDIWEGGTETFDELADYGYLGEKFDSRFEEHFGWLPTKAQLKDWRRQARLAADRQWEQLDALQAALRGEPDSPGEQDAAPQSEAVGLGKLISGIDSEDAAKLKDQNITSPTALLEAAGDPAGRSRLAKETGIDERAILDWVNRVDLMRVKGIGIEYSNLLEEAGVDTVKELARRNPDNLHAALVEAKEKQELVQVVPSPSKVKDWVKQAKSLKPAVDH